jgi:hypothetical protein
MAEYPVLEQLFAHNKPFLEKITQDDPHGFVRFRAERVISEALKAGIIGVDKLVSDSGGDCRKFKNLTHEVMVALCLQRLPANVSLLGDCAFGPAPIYTPDLEITTADARTILVEVTCRSSGATAISIPIREMIEKGKFPFRISYTLGSALSSSAIEFNNREIQENIVQKTIELATRELTRLSTSPGASGLITIRDPDKAAEITLGVEIDGAWDAVLESRDFIACFHFEPTTDGKGYAAGGITGVHFIPDDEMVSAFLRDIERKAKKRDKLPNEKRNFPFIVVYVSEEQDLMPQITSSALTGQTTWLASATSEEQKRWVASSRDKKPKPVREAIELAYQNQWGSTLDDWGHGLEGLMAFHKDGLYLDAVHMPESAWGRNLTGVLILRNNGTHLQWLPNPFSEDASITSWLQEVLPQGKDGALL